ALLGGERLTARELDLPVHRVDRDDLDLDLVAHFHDVGRLTHAARGELRDVEQSVHAGQDLNEAPVRLDAHDGAEILGPDLRHGRDLADRLDALLGGPEVARGHRDGAVVLHVDLAGVLLLERADRLAAGADDVADLLFGHGDRQKARRERRELGARGLQRLLHLVEDEEAAVARLFERLLEDLRRDAADLDVHLERGDALAGAGDLEVHVAVMVFLARDVGQNGESVAFLHESHRDARDRALDGHAGAHERDRGGSVRFEDVGDDADRVREFLLVGEDGLEGAPREAAVADLAAAGGAEALDLPDGEPRGGVGEGESAAAY